MFFQIKGHLSLNERRSALESIKSGTEMRHQSSEVGPTDIDLINQSFGMIDQEEEEVDDRREQRQARQQNYH